MDPTLCFINEAYFKKNNAFTNMLDPGNSQKQSKRTYLCIGIKCDKNHFYIPLRNNLGPEIRKFGRIGHAVPSKKRPNAGLDYRYTLLINDSSYIEIPKQIKIPMSQYNLIKSDYAKIQSEFEVYLNGFIKAAKKMRNSKEPLYKVSSLVNYFSELGIEEKKVEDLSLIEF